MNGHAWPSVSACLIAKNESDNIGACLSSLEGQVDEIIVVDTGSTDDTVAIAGRFGCRILHSPWRDDFSTPRNLGLENATGDWILYIDADERLACPPARPLASFLTQDDAAAALVRFHPRSDMTPYSEYRLFRRDPRIRFVGAMHESMLPGIFRVCAEDGSHIVERFDIEIFHYGYEGDQSHKYARNLPLLQRAVADDPLRVYLRFDLGRTLFFVGQVDEAIVELRKGMDNAALERSSGRARVEGSICAQVLAAALIEKGEAGEALETVEEGLALYPDNLGLRWTRARALVAMGRPNEALAELEPLLGMDAGQVFDPVIAYEKSLFGPDTLGLAGSACFALGDFEQARSFFEQAAERAADPLEFTAKAALARARAKRSHQG